MRTKRSLVIPVIALASVVLFLVACQQSQKPQPTPMEELKSAASEKVYVVFEGPWAIVEDPKDPNSILALAPKTKMHRDLFVAASNDSTLAPGTYDLSVPAHGASTSGPLDPSFAQAKIDAKSLQHAIDDKTGRYVIRLPKPEAYVAAKRFRSRVSSKYVPEATAEQNYATHVSLRYTVSSLNGFSLAGTPDTGTFNPLLLQLDTPTIRFAIEPAQMDDPTDRCNVHSRAAFRDTAKFLGLALFVDFPNDPEDCHKTDPQIRATAKAGQGPSLNLAGALLIESAEASPTTTRRKMTIGRSEMLTTIVGPTFVVHDLTDAMYLFHATGTACRAPILFLTTTP
jgi:hypothetical protein